MCSVAPVDGEPEIIRTHEDMVRLLRRKTTAADRQAMAHLAHWALREIRMMASHRRAMGSPGADWGDSDDGYRPIWLLSHLVVEMPQAALARRRLFQRRDRRPRFNELQVRWISSDETLRVWMRWHLDRVGYDYGWLEDCNLVFGPELGGPSKQGTSQELPRRA